MAVTIIFSTAPYMMALDAIYYMNLNLADATLVELDWECCAGSSVDDLASIHAS